MSVVSEEQPLPERPARFDTTDDDRRDEGLEAATLAVRKGELVLLPTDTVYGIGCDAFEPEAVQRLLDAKGRGRDMPPPVLVSTQTTLDALASEVPDYTRFLTDEFWPGPLTVVCTQQSSLQWDLGDTRGTVAVRMPDHDVALDLIQRTGPLAVSSANLTGRPAALDADAAVGMLADEVTVVLDAGRTPGELASTIVDCTGDRPRVLREGAITLDRLREFLDGVGHPLAEGDDEEPPAADSDATSTAGSAPASDSASDSASVPDDDIVDDDNAAADIVDAEIVDEGDDDDQPDFRFLDGDPDQSDEIDDEDDDEDGQAKYPDGRRDPPGA